MFKSIQCHDDELEPPPLIKKQPTPRNTSYIHGRSVENDIIDQDTLCMIYSFMEFPEALKVSRTCVAWYQGLFTHIHTFCYDGSQVRVETSFSNPKTTFIGKSYTYQVSKMLNPIIMDMFFRNCKHITKFIFSNSRSQMKQQFIESCIKRACELWPYITEMDLSYCCQLSDNGIKPLLMLTGLKKLNIKCCCKFGYHGMNIISQITTLKQLNLASLSITDNDFALLTTLTNLEKLNLFNCTNLTNNALQHLIKLSKLSRLNISGYSDTMKFTADATKSIGQLTNLTKLNLSFLNKIKSKDLQHMTNMSKLRNLQFQEMKFNEHVLEGLAISHLTSLEILNLSHCDLHYKGLRQLCVLTRLKELNISYTKIDKVDCIAQLTNLQYLNLRRCPIKAENLECLKYMTTITKLEQP